MAGLGCATGLLGSALLAVKSGVSRYGWVAFGVSNVAWIGGLWSGAIGLVARAEVETVILDCVVLLPEPPYTPDDKDAMAKMLYEHMWQQSVGGAYVVPQARPGKHFSCR